MNAATDALDQIDDFLVNRIALLEDQIITRTCQDWPAYVAACALREELLRLQDEVARLLKPRQQENFNADSQQQALDAAHELLKRREPRQPPY